MVACNRSSKGGETVASTCCNRNLLCAVRAPLQPSLFRSSRCRNTSTSNCIWQIVFAHIMATEPAWGVAPQANAWADAVDEEEAQHGVPPAPLPLPEDDFPSLGAAVKQGKDAGAKTKKPKGQKMDLGAFLGGGGRAAAPSRTNDNELLMALPKASSGLPREERGSGALGGAFKDYGGQRDGGFPGQRAAAAAWQGVCNTAAVSLFAVAVLDTISCKHIGRAGSCSSCYQRCQGRSHVEATRQYWACQHHHAWDAAAALWHQPGSSHNQGAACQYHQSASAPSHVAPCSALLQDALHATPGCTVPQPLTHPCHPPHPHPHPGFRGGRRGGDEEYERPVSKADMSSNWGAERKFVPSDGPPRASGGGGGFGSSFSRDREGGAGGGGGFRDREERRSGFDDRPRGEADTSDNWGANRKFVPNEGPARGGPGGGGFGGGGGFKDREGGFREGGRPRYDEPSRADAGDWGSRRAPPSPPGGGAAERGGRRGFGFSEAPNSAADTEDRWVRRGAPAEPSSAAPAAAAGPSERPRLNLAPRTKPVEAVKPATLVDGATPPSSTTSPTAAAAAGAANGTGPSSSDGAAAAAGPPKPKVNPFGAARPREEVLKEKGIDYVKEELKLEHGEVIRWGPAAPAAETEVMTAGRGEGGRALGLRQGAEAADAVLATPLAGLSSQVALLRWHGPGLHGLRHGRSACSSRVEGQLLAWLCHPRSKCSAPSNVQQSMLAKIILVAEGRGVVCRWGVASAAPAGSFLCSPAVAWTWYHWCSAWFLVLTTDMHLL